MKKRKAEEADLLKQKAEEDLRAQMKMALEVMNKIFKGDKVDTATWEQVDKFMEKRGLRVGEIEEDRAEEIEELRAELLRQIETADQTLIELLQQSKVSAKMVKQAEEAYKKALDVSAKHQAAIVAGYRAKGFTQKTLIDVEKSIAEKQAKEQEKQKAEKQAEKQAQEQEKQKAEKQAKEQAQEQEKQKAKEQTEKQVEEQAAEHSENQVLEIGDTTPDEIS